LRRRPRPKLGCGAKGREKKKKQIPWSRVYPEVSGLAACSKNCK
jgi:hypothetical protein